MVINIILFYYFIGILLIIGSLSMFPSCLTCYFSKDVLKNSIAELPFCLIFYAKLMKFLGHL